MKLSYQISRLLANKFCFGHNIGVSVSMHNEMVHIKVCCNYFRAEIESALVHTYTQDFVAKNIKFNCGGMVTRVELEDNSDSQLQTTTDRLILKQEDSNDD